MWERPPRIRLYKRAFRKGRSWEFSLQEGGAAPRDRGGVGRGCSDPHGPPSGLAIRVEVQACAVTWAGVTVRPCSHRASLSRMVLWSFGIPPTGLKDSFVPTRMAWRMRSSAVQVLAVEYVTYV